MTTHRFSVVLEEDTAEGVWVTTVPALNGLSTFGATREEALSETREAILGYLEALAKDNLPVPPGDGVIELVEVEVVSV